MTKKTVKVIKRKISIWDKINRLYNKIRNKHVFYDIRYVYFDYDGTRKSIVKSVPSSKVYAECPLSDDLMNNMTVIVERRYWKW